MDFVLDFGNARLKWFDPRNNSFSDDRHAIVALDEYQWNDIAGRGKPPKGIIKVNGSTFAIGDAARRYTIPEKPKGASRYRPDYYGVGLCYAMSECFKRSVKNVTLFGSHAPADVRYRSFLSQAAMGKWEVVSRHGTFEFEVKDVKTFDEPLGGYSHFVFTEKGKPIKRNPLEKVDTLVIDAGGYTIDVGAIDAYGTIDLLSLHSTRSGSIAVTEQFEGALRGNNPLMFQDTGEIDIKRIERAILTGVFQMGKTAIDCKVEAKAAINRLTNDAIQVINAAGGVANFEYMLLTGGGSAMIYEALQVAMPRAQFLLAETKTDNMKYANVFGGAKIAALLRNMGEL